MSKPSELPPRLRRCARVLRMVHELHKLGLQRLRVIPYYGHNGVWRCCITHTGGVYAAHRGFGESTSQRR